MGSLPPGLKSPNRASATAWPVSWPRYQHSKITGTSRLSELMESGRPLKRKTITGLPVATMARTSSSWRPMSERLARSPMCTKDQASREVCSLPPMASTITSALFATLTASSRPGFARGLLVAADGEHDHIGPFRHFDGFGNLAAIFGGIAGDHFILHPGAADGDLAAFAVEHFGADTDPGPDAIEHRDVMLGNAAVAAQQAAVGVGSDDRD